MTRPTELHPDLDDGIDRQMLREIRSRFLSVNSGRLERARQALSPRQQTVLRLLPLLFHVNHPILPGYVSASTPCGLDGYEPDADALAEAQRLSRSFTYAGRRGRVERAVQGLFLMGSLGTVAQDEHSDFDVWVCHDPALDDRARQELQRKCDLLRNWATDLGATATFFLIDPQRFAQGLRGGDLRGEDCGSTQHYLLLDEFYRTALWLGGRTPVWWLVPAYEEHRYPAYVETLLTRRFVRADEVIDLGHLGHIPPGEFLGAGLWQLYKGIESPYKSALKLLLTEVYASEHPQVECLSLRFKQAVYADQLALNELDPYIAVYQRLAEYLQARGDGERLELIRRSLYLKINRKLSRPPGPRGPSWQRLVLERLTRDWGWDARQLALLDNRSQWKVRQVTAERRALVNALTFSYRFLSQFARAEGAISPLSARDLSVLGRRLYAAFERKAGKVEFINPGISPDMAEDALTLVRSSDAEGEGSWALYGGSLNARQWPDHAPLKRARQLVPLLAWSHLNGVIDASSRVSLYAGDSGLSEAELHALLHGLRQALPMPLAGVGEDALLEPSAPRHVLLLLHLDDASAALVADGESSAQSRPAEERVHSIDQLTLNSWNELTVSHHDAPEALLDCLRDYLQALPSSGAPPRLRVYCLNRSHGPAVTRRVYELFAEVQQALGRAPGSRYLLHLHGRHHVFELVPGAIGHACLPDQASLLEHLGQPYPGYRPIELDARTLASDALALVLSHGRPDCLQVFYRVQGEQAMVMVLDEHNALWHQLQPYHDEASLLRPLQRFLQSVLYRQNALLPLPGQAPASLRDILYYRVSSPQPGRPAQLERRSPPPGEIVRPFYDVQAIVEPGEGRARIALYCNHREFSELEHGAQLFARAAQHILAHRRGTQRYPCYLTDLDLSGLPGEAAQTVQYLRYKTRLEAALNQAVERLSHSTLP